MDDLIRRMIESVDLSHEDWTDETDRLIAEAAARYAGRNLAEVIVQSVAASTHLDKLGCIFEIILNGYPGIDDVAVGRSLYEWVWEDDEAKFRCSISVRHVLVHCRESAMARETFEALKAKWPQYEARLSELISIWE
jgi:hypothetical protein